MSLHLVRTQLRWATLGLVALAPNLCLLPKTGASEAVISSVSVQGIAVVPNNNGDTWVPAWARDGTLYSPSDDGGGFRCRIETNIHFNKITGDNPEKLDGETVNPMLEYGKATEVGPDASYGLNHSYGPASFLYKVGRTETQAQNERSSLPSPIGGDSSGVAAEILGTLRNDFTGYVGCMFTAGSTLTVNSLGRWVVLGNTRSHRVEIVDSGDGAVVASAVVETSGQAAGKFAYAALGAPVNLAPNHGYYLVSLETKGSDSWCDDETTLRSSADITINHPEFQYQGGYRMDGRSWKSSGCLALDGALYLVVARHHYGARQTARDASIIKSLDGGITWTRTLQENLEHPLFPGFRFATPYFIDFGQDGKQSVADGSDRYVYALSNNGFWDNGDNMVLGRVLRAKMGDLTAADWQFFKTGDGASDTNWSPSLDEARPVINRPNHLGMGGPVYLPTQKCYFMIGWYYPAGGGRETIDASKTTLWDFYFAPRPWGPWRKVGSHRFYPQGYYNPQVCLKFTSQDGSLIQILTAGDFNAGKFPLACVSLLLK